MQGGEATTRLWSVTPFLIHSFSHSPLLASLVATRRHHEVPNPSVLLVVTGRFGDALVLSDCVVVTVAIAVATEVVVHCVVGSEETETETETDVIVVFEYGDCTCSDH
jgi:hypothetical protein